MAAKNTTTLNPPFGSDPNRLHSSPVSASLIGVAPASLDLDRCRRRLGLKWLKIGARVMYRESDLLEFLKRCERA